MYRIRTERQDRKPGLCYRCEHRAGFLEKGHGPRCECGDVLKAYTCCYMFQPVMPVVLEPARKSDPRPLLGPPCIAGRVRLRRRLEKEELQLKVSICETDGLVACWEIRPGRKKKGKNKDA
jgi:hypothetical protein